LRPAAQPAQPTKPATKPKPTKPKRVRRKRAAAPTPAPAGKYAWGLAAIAAQIDRSANSVDWMLRSGFLKSPRKVGGVWCVEIEALHRELRGVES
jgi:hypothetical protein